MAYSAFDHALAAPGELIATPPCAIIIPRAPLPRYPGKPRRC
jgi:hypothetical protein